MSPGEKKSFWERHEHKFYKYGHIYANIYGQVMIDYMPQEPLQGPLKQLLIAYSHVFSLMLIVVAPCYFGYNYRQLMATIDRRMQLVLYVSFANTLIKYATVIVTYMANMLHFKAINHRCTWKRARLESNFADNYHGTRSPQRRFELFMYYKFGLINLMMVIQVCGILAVAGGGDTSADAAKLRLQFAIYSFVLWNYTENMADYFYYMNSSVLKYLRQLHRQLHGLLGQAQQLSKVRRNGRCGRGMFMLYCCQLCDQLSVLRQRFMEIHDLHVESFRMHHLQLLGLMLTTLINNLTNLFTIFSLLATHSLGHVSYPVVVSAVYALAFYLDTYIVTLVNEQIKLELCNLALTMRQFCSYPSLQPPRLDQELEHFSLQLLQHRQPMLCGLLHLDRRLIYLISVTAFSYFITLVQFDLYLRTTR